MKDFFFLLPSENQPSGHFPSVLRNGDLMLVRYIERMKNKIESGGQIGLIKK